MHTCKSYKKRTSVSLVLAGIFLFSTHNSVAEFNLLSFISGAVCGAALFAGGILTFVASTLANNTPEKQLAHLIQEYPSLTTKQNLETLQHHTLKHSNNQKNSNLIFFW